MVGSLWSECEDAVAGSGAMCQAGAGQVLMKGTLCLILMNWESDLTKFPFYRWTSIKQQEDGFDKVEAGGREISWKAVEITEGRQNKDPNEEWCVKKETDVTAIHRR